MLNMSSNNEMEQKMEKYLSINQVCELLNVSKSWLALHRKNGTGIPFLIMGKRSIRYRLCDCESFLKTPEEAVVEEKKDRYSAILKGL